MQGTFLVQSRIKQREPARKESPGANGSAAKCAPFCKLLRECQCNFAKRGLLLPPPVLLRQEARMLGSRPHTSVAEMPTRYGLVQGPRTVVMVLQVTPARLSKGCLGGGGACQRLLLQASWG